MSKYYLVTWDEIEDLRVASQLHGKFGREKGMGLIEARDKCKARPLPPWATHYVKLNGLNNIEQMEEITK